jgi:hypothetical protein
LALRLARGSLLSATALRSPGLALRLARGSLLSATALRETAAARRSATALPATGGKSSTRGGAAT